MEFVKLGTLKPDTWEFVYGRERAQVQPDHIAIPVFEWAIRRIVAQDEFSSGYAIRHCGTCGACGRPLSVEESVIRGIGPVCYGKAVERANRAKILVSDPDGQMSLIS